MIFVSCKVESKHKGFTLQNFKVVNGQLDSIIRGINDSTHILKQKGYVIILVLRVYDSKPEFCLTSAEKEAVSEKYIYLNNRRIVGYLDNGNDEPIIILSTDCNKYDFESTFYTFLNPTGKKKYFEYIYFPDNQYSLKNDGTGYPPSFFDPYFYYYRYQENNIVPVTYDR
ncbi:hypothetical protein BSYN_03060 [Bacteroides sedimenti]|uniref:Lipoprotein n=2 Tax=Bacteroides sedimenti TaxID=2136147 RepID=A0ABM8I961_9BACE